MGVLTLQAGFRPTLVNTKSLSFAGDNDYVTIGQPSDLEWDPDAKECTIDLWFKPTDNTNQRFLVAKAKMETVSVSYVIAQNNDGTVYAIVGGGNGNGGSLVAGTWNHILLTVRNVGGIYTAFLFLNGAQVAEILAGPLQNTDVDWMVGAARWNDNVSDSYPFLGLEQNVSWWNGAFTDAQVTERYAGGKPQDPRRHSRAGVLLHWLPLGQGDTYPTMTDRKGSANGTCTNMAGAGVIVSDVP